MATLRLERRDVFAVCMFTVALAHLSPVTPAAIEAVVTTVQFGVQLWPVLVMSSEG